MITKPDSVSLTARFLMMLTCLSAVLAILAIFIFHTIRSERMGEALALQIGVISAEISPLIAEADEKGDSLTRTRLVKSLFAFPSVSCVHLMRRQDDQPVTSWPARGCAPSSDDIEVPASEGVLLRLKIDSDYAEEQVRHATWLFAGFVLAVLGGIAGLVLLCVNSFVIRPLDRLRTAMEQSAPDNPVLARDIGNDEIGHVARAYNRLAAAARVFFTQLRQTEAKVRASEMRFRDMAEISGDWFYEMDADLNFSYVSDRFFEITGLLPEDVIGQRRASLAADNLADPHWQAHSAILAQHKAFRDFEYPLATKDGAICFVSANGKPIYDEEGVFRGYRGTGRNVTLLKEKESQLAEANRNFGDSVTYASRFQHQMLVRPQDISPRWGQLELVWQPRDMVGGDFLASFSLGRRHYLVCFDCTGHGVPGAFMVMIVSAVIDRIRYRATRPLGCHALLSQIHLGVCDALHIPKGGKGEDGLDCGVLALDEEDDMIRFAGASIDLFVLKDGQPAKRVKSDNCRLGYQNLPLGIDAKDRKLKTANTSFVMMTDGLATQIGGAQSKMFGMARLTSLLNGDDKDNIRAENSPHAITRQMMRALRLWQGQQERRDDVMIIALRPDSQPAIRL